MSFVGKTAVADSDLEIVFASYIVRFKTNKLVDPFYLSYWFSDPRCRSRLGALSTAGVSQSNINPTVLKNAVRVKLGAGGAELVESGVEGVQFFGGERAELSPVGSGIKHT